MSTEILSDGDLMLLGIVRNCAGIAKKRIDADGKRAIETTLTWLDAFLIRGEQGDRERLRLSVIELINYGVDINTSEPLWSVINACQYFLSKEPGSLQGFYTQYEMMLTLLLFNASQTEPLANK